MNKVRSALIGTSLIVAITFYVGVYAHLLNNRHRPSAFGTGSSEYAELWKTRLQKFDEPELAQAEYPEVVFKRFPNGEWVFGIDKDSHRHPDGGTIVVKDSTGKIRAFFGHVCGDRYLMELVEYTNSLEDFYGPKSIGGRFAEHTFGDQSRTSNPP